MPLPARDHRISFADAAALTKRYRENRPPTINHAAAFHADQVGDLLKQPGCVALRIYRGTNPDGTDAVILVGVDANDREMTGGILLEFCFPCPPFCPGGGSLNG